MELLELIILFMIAITASNVLSRVFPSIPVFLVQILLGVLIGLTKYGSSISFSPETFLVLIIAPLLFREGEHADIPMFLKNFGMILALAFGGVILTLAAVGVTLHLLMPLIPLAGCFALGAALGPTDAVAVGSILKRLKIPKDVMGTLEGEGLLNDASGVTAFQFAVAALVTGSFSLGSASLTLFTASIGGFAVGFGVVWLKQKIIHMIETAEAREVTAYLMIELVLPFAAYFVAEEVHVSGIIAAVVAGVMQARGYRKVSIFEAELANISQSTWSTITFTLNGLVFLFLGIEISQVYAPIWEDGHYSNFQLILVIVALTVMLFGIRFLFVSFVYALKERRLDLRKFRNEILLLTFGGVKGTVSLATIFIIPTMIDGRAFGERGVLLFLTAGVILLSLLVGMIILPILSDGEVDEPVDRNGLAVLHEVVAQLEADSQEPTVSDNDKVAIHAVIQDYDERIWELYTQAMTDSEKKEVQEIQALILSIERDGLDESYRRGEISANGYRFYSRFLANFQNSVTRQILSFIGFWFLFVRRALRVIMHPQLFWERRQQRETDLRTQDLQQLQQVYKHNSQLIRKSLDNLQGVYDQELLDHFLKQRKDLGPLNRENFIATMLIRQDQSYVKEMLRGYYLERKIIDEYEVGETITTFSANEYRGRVNLLESYAMSQLGEGGLSKQAFRLKRLTRK